MGEYVKYNSETGKVEINKDTDKKLSDVKSGTTSIRLSDNFILNESPNAVNGYFFIYTDVSMQWKISVNCDWLKVKLKMGYGNQLIEYGITNNDTNARRTAQIKVTTIDDQYQILYVVQRGEYLNTYRKLLVDTEKYVDVEVPHSQSDKINLICHLTNTIANYGIITIGTTKIGISENKIMCTNGEKELESGYVCVEIDKYGIRYNGTIITSKPVDMSGTLTLRLSKNIQFDCLTIQKHIQGTYIPYKVYKPTKSDLNVILHDLINDNEIYICNVADTCNKEPTRYSYIALEDDLKMLSYSEKVSIVSYIENNDLDWSVQAYSSYDWLKVETINHDAIRISVNENCGETRLGIIVIKSWESTIEYTITLQGKNEFEKVYAIATSGKTRVVTGITYNPSTDNILVKWINTQKNSNCPIYTTDKGFVVTTEKGKYKEINIDYQLINDSENDLGTLFLFDTTTDIAFKYMKVFRNNTPILYYIPIIKDGKPYIFDLISQLYIEGNDFELFTEKDMNKAHISLKNTHIEYPRPYEMV